MSLVSHLHCINKVLSAAGITNSLECTAAESACKRRMCLSSSASGTATSLMNVRLDSWKCNGNKRIHWHLCRQSSAAYTSTGSVEVILCFLLRTRVIRKRAFFPVPASNDEYDACSGQLTLVESCFKETCHTRHTSLRTAVFLALPVPLPAASVCLERLANGRLGRHHRLSALFTELLAGVHNVSAKGKRPCTCTKQHASGGIHMRRRGEGLS